MTNEHVLVQQVAVVEPFQASSSDKVSTASLAKSLSHGETLTLLSRDRYASGHKIIAYSCGSRAPKCEFTLAWCRRRGSVSHRGQQRGNGATSSNIDVNAGADPHAMSTTIVPCISNCCWYSGISNACSRIVRAERGYVDAPVAPKCHSSLKGSPSGRTLSESSDAYVRKFKYRGVFGFRVSSKHDDASEGKFRIRCSLASHQSSPFLFFVVKKALAFPQQLLHVSQYRHCAQSSVGETCLRKTQCGGIAMFQRKINEYL